MGESLGASGTLVLSEMISSSKYPVILAKSIMDNTDYVIKMYAHDSFAYSREKQFMSSLKHPNIINHIPRESFKVHNIPNEAKFIIMEFAPYGDFFSLIINHNINNEKLIRTYFRQLIEGVEHLHQQGIAHLDLKLENLLLGKDHLLKIADFDTAQYIQETNYISQGSENYRPPELKEGKCTNYQAADIFSVGVCLFIMISRAFPFVEKGNQFQKKFQNYYCFLSKNHDFWKGMETLLRKNSLFSEHLIELLNGMWAGDPNLRLTTEKIKLTQWYNKSIYSQEELREVLNVILNKEM